MRAITDDVVSRLRVGDVEETILRVILESIFGLPPGEGSVASCLGMASPIRVAIDAVT